MTIEALVAAVPPPAAPFEPYAGLWETVEAALGTPLPPDYKDFLRLYASGKFMEFLAIHVPRSRSPYLRLVSEAHAITGIFRQFEEPPYPVWPEPDGLLPFGKTDFGDYLFWLCRGPPADWNVVVWDRGFGDYETFECDLTDFLAGLATGVIEPKGFPEELLPCDRLFRPHSLRDRGEFRLTWKVSYGGSPAQSPVSKDDAGEPD
jgi:hypothetical protein